MRTLDEALGVERPKGFRMDAASRHAMFGGAIFIEVNKRLETEQYDDDIFEEVGKKWSIGKTATKQIYSSELRYFKEKYPETYKQVLSSRASRKKPAVSSREKR